ncbi:hypothetical protein RJ639_040576 [Escallonia herrerae]|uniref:SHSP domain-containing protein n=1 Tax=Escallonia herrerae TaxID=1293975 RepID=A0AA89BCK9_9ASTE|nr:hypothetical protein RJ639_040576 [Escallonia herrerae]
MENQVARRRVNMIAAHFAANDDISATHLFPMNCSSSLNSVVRRGANRMYFARQGSSSQACFMRQSSTEQGTYGQLGGTIKCADSSNERFSKVIASPFFSQTATAEPNIPAADPPRFSRPSRGLKGQKQFQVKKKIHSRESSGGQWSPRMDVSESRLNFVVTLELPGVCASDIKVEINDKRLIVKGNRLTKRLKNERSSGDPIAAFQKREILHGAYEVGWPLPHNVDKENISAELV